LSKYDDAIKIMVERYTKDELWSISTLNGDSHTVRIVSGYYEDGAVYTVTHALSTKMKDMEANPKVALCTFWYTGHGIGENLGWVRDEKNAEMMVKVRAAFAEWYDNGHTDEEDPNTCLLCIRLTDGIIIDHDRKYGEFRYAVDFVNKTAQ
jgi:general stress protein 26